MFPCYVFTQLVFGEDDTAPISSTTGCRGLGGFGFDYSPVPEAAMVLLFSASPSEALQSNGKESIFKAGELV